MASSGKWIRSSFIWLALALVIVVIIVLFFRSSSDATPVDVSTLLNNLQTDILTASSTRSQSARTR